MRISIYAIAGQATVKKDVIRRMVRRALKAEGKQLNTINIIIADDAYLKNLNEIYFNKKRPTSVISFDLDEVSEIYISRDRAKHVDELYYYIMHGLLHLIGYDHCNKRESVKMQKKCMGYLVDG
jgi:probable rRNA maturation factor